MIYLENEITSGRVTEIDLTDKLLDLIAEARRMLVLPSAPPQAPTHEPAERETMQLIDERDGAEEWADKLAYAVGPVEDIGEHSNDNNPWANALEILKNRGSSGNYVANRETNPTEVKFENGRRVFLNADGFLDVDFGELGPTHEQAAPAPEEKFVHGFAYALANLIRLHGDGSEARDLFRESGYKMEDFSKAGVDEYDLEILRGIEWMK